MSINLIYNLKQDGTISSSFPVQSAVNKIQDLVFDQNWRKLLEKHEYRIIDSIRLSEKAYPTDNIGKATCTMELCPLESTGKDTPGYTCIIKCLDNFKLNAKESSITNLKKTLDLLPFGVAIIRRDKHVYIMNQAALDLAGYSSMEEFNALKMPCQDTFCPAPKNECPIWDKGQKFDKTERGFLMRDGTSIQVLKSAVQVDFEGETMMLEGIIDLRKQKDLEILAYSDALTGILNRKGIHDKFTYISEQIEKNAQNYNIMMFDLDNFKLINDNHGHFTGDNILRFFVQCVKKELQCEDFFCRWGGDEFLLITQLDIPSCVQTVHQITKNSKIGPYEDKDWINLLLGFSVGIANIKQGMTLDQAVNKADGYMYNAKRNNSKICFEQENKTNLI